MKIRLEGSDFPERQRFEHLGIGRRTAQDLPEGLRRKIAAGPAPREDRRRVAPPG